MNNDKIGHFTSNDVFNKPINGIRECKWCHQKFDNISGSQLANHIRWCKENPNRGKGLKEKLQDSIKQKMLEKYGAYQKFQVQCANSKCGNYFFVIEREKKFPTKTKYFCCRKCANSHIVSDEQKQKTSQTLKHLSKYLRQNDPEKFSKCFGMRSNNRRFTSTNECLIRDYVIQNFPDDKWTFGGCLIVDGLGITRDLYSNKLKVCFEYDGIWHFKNIHDQLELKQKKDKALEKWCIEHKYRLVRVSETWFLNNNKDVKPIIQMLYDNSKQIIKCGIEYNI